MYLCKPHNIKNTRKWIGCIHVKKVESRIITVCKNRKAHNDCLKKKRRSYQLRSTQILRSNHDDDHPRSIWQTSNKLQPLPHASAWKLAIREIQCSLNSGAVEIKLHFPSLMDRGWDWCMLVMAAKILRSNPMPTARRARVSATACNKSWTYIYVYISHTARPRGWRRTYNI